MCLVTTTFSIECMEKFIPGAFKKNGNGHSSNGNGYKNGNNNNGHMNEHGSSNGHSINGNGNNGHGNKSGINKSKRNRSLSSNNLVTLNPQQNRSLNISPINNNHSITIPPTEDVFITAVKCGDQVRIQGFLANPYFNPNGRTALHISIEGGIKNRNFLSLQLLIEDPRIDITELNKDLQTAHNVLKIYRLKETEPILKAKMIMWSFNLFKRGLIQASTDKICKYELQPLLTTNGLITPDNMTEAIEEITKDIETTGKSQINDRELPQSCSLPEYATTEFMTKLIWFTLNKNRLQINSTSTNFIPIVK